MPKNVVIPLSEYEKSEKKKTSHHSMNPIVHWPTSRTISVRNKFFDCKDKTLPSKVRKQIEFLKKNNIKCNDVNLLTNGSYIIDGNDGMKYVIGETMATGKRQRSKKKRTRKKR